MQNRDKPSKWAHILVTGIICLLVAFTIIPRVYTICHLSREYHSLQQQKTALLKVNHQLHHEALEANSSANIEKIAREQLGMIKPGEKKVQPVIPDK